jgi:hypothetical protein
LGNEIDGGKNDHHCRLVMQTYDKNLRDFHRWFRSQADGDNHFHYWFYYKPAVKIRTTAKMFFCCSVSIIGQAAHLLKVASVNHQFT